MTRNQPAKVPDTNLTTEECHEGRTARMTDRITVGLEAGGRSVEVYVTDAYDNADPAEVVIALDEDPREDSKWGVLAITDPRVAWRLAETLTAAGHVLDRIKAGEI